jgi:hypothetical protein
MGVFSWLKSRVLPLYRSHTPSGLGHPHSLVAEPGRDSRRGAAIKEAAAADVARLEEDDKYFGHGAPGSREDDL